jgi:copper chaperone
MRKSFEVANMRCEGCAATIRSALSRDFGDNIEIDLTTMPRKVTVDIEDAEHEALFIERLRKLGYPLYDDDISGIEGAVMKGKSFVSCAIGKFNPTKENK